MQPLQMLFPQHVKYVNVSIFSNSSFAIAKSQIGTDDTVASGSEAQENSLTGNGKKHIGQSSLAGGFLNSISSRNSAACSLHSFLCFGQ